MARENPRKKESSSLIYPIHNRDREQEISCYTHCAKGSIPFHSILFYSILFYSILFYSILFGSSPIHETYVFASPVHSISYRISIHPSRPHLRPPSCDFPNSAPTCTHATFPNPTMLAGMTKSKAGTGLAGTLLILSAICPFGI